MNIHNIVEAIGWVSIYLVITLIIAAHLGRYLSKNSDYYKKDKEY